VTAWWKELTAMPLYTVTTQDGLLSAEQRDPRGHTYVAANRSPVASILGIIRAGRAPEQKTRLVRALWPMFQDNTGVSDGDLSVALHEVAPGQAMENGAIMPEIGHKKEIS
jgi:phenylpyruvate tautomerase PptA (4-oxalocrotonate tautomerase family)